MGNDRTPLHHYPTEEFRANTARQFGFLQTEFGFDNLLSVRDRGFAVATYDKADLRVRIGYDQFRGEIDVDFVRASEDGAFPDYLDRPDLWISLDMLVAYRTQGQALEPKPSDLDKQVSHDADIVRRHASDLLSGDLSVFPVVREFIAQRAAASGSPTV